MDYQECLYNIKNLVKNKEYGEIQETLEKAWQALEDCIEMGLTGEGD